MKILGVDCAGVLFYPYGKSVTGAIQNLQKLTQENRFDEIYLISRVNFLGRVLFPLYLNRLHFWEQTGIPKDHLYFVNYDSDKVSICEDLGITDFVDNSYSVLRHMVGVVDRCYAFKQWKVTDLIHPAKVRNVTRVKSWEEFSLIAGAVSK